MKTIIRYLSKSDFDTFKKTLLSVNDDFDSTEQYALTITSKSKTIIVICNDPSLTKNEKDIILQHERQHARGVSGEEDADFGALDNLNDKAKDLLIQNWKGRHGHDYEYD